VAEYEARLISERTKAGLAAAKARGVKIGGWENRTRSPGHPAGLAKARQIIKEKMVVRTADLAPVIADIRAAGFVSLAAVARQLTARGIRPLRADRWSLGSARRLLTRLSCKQSVSEARQAQCAAKQHWITTIAPVFVDVRQSGHCTLTSIGRELNARGVPTFHGKQWDISAVHNALKCLPEDQSQSIYLTQKEFASRLRQVIEQIQAAGETGVFSIASALNARGIPGINGGIWRRVQVHRLLKRISMVAKRRTVANWLPGFASRITEVRAAGHLSAAAIASELNARGVGTCLGGRWTVPRVYVTLRAMRRYKIDYEPWLPCLARIVAEVRAAGHLSPAEIASELNARGVRPCRGSGWTTRRLSETLNKMRRCEIDYEPKKMVPPATTKSTGLRPARRSSKSKRPSRVVRKFARAPQPPSPKRGRKR
jgi:hypothetical protein